MANTTNSIVYGGYVYKVGDTIKLTNNILYTSITASSGNTVNMLSQCVMQITAIWEGSSSGVAVKNPLQLKWYSGPSGSYNGGGYARLDQVSLGSGGTSTVTAGNMAVYAYDQRINTTVDASGWAESFYIDWNSFGANNGNSIDHYEIWYQEASDAGGKPGTWSGRVWLQNVWTTSYYGHTIIGTLNQSRSASDWGGRGYWYRFSVVALGKNGGYSNTTIFTNYLRKCNVYTYNFNLNGGSGSPTVQYKFTKYNFQMPTKPSKTGYSFINWRYDSSGWNPNQIVSNLPDANLSSIWANWSANTYKIIYKGNGGTWNGTDTWSDNVVFDTDYYVEPNFFDRKGYTFVSWNTNPNGNGEDWGTTIGKPWRWNRTYDVTVYAIWRANEYTLTVNPSGGTWNGSTRLQEFTQSYGSTKEIPAPTRTGYNFVRWDISGSGSIDGTTFTFGNGDTTLIAVWEINSYTISYNANGGTNAPKSQIKSYGMPLILTTSKPTRNGHTFQSWNTLSDGTGTKYNPGDSYTANASVTLYAQWEENTCKVTFDANGGYIILIDKASDISTIQIPLTDENGNSLLTNYSQQYYPVFLSADTTQTFTKDVQYGNPIDVLPIAEKLFYKFIGWFTSPTGGTQINEDTVIYDDVTYYAHYESRFYVYTDGNWHRGELYGYTNNNWIHHAVTVKENNKWS